MLMIFTSTTDFLVNLKSYVIFEVQGWENVIHAKEGGGKTGHPLLNL